MDLNRFNPRQRQAITHVGSPLLVLAGAGSGKTSVITHKIAWLIQEAGIPARHITAVTFTNKASREMRERINHIAPKDQIRGLTISTFHSFGLNLLRRESYEAGLKSGFSILDTEDSKTILSDLLRRESIEDRDIVSGIQQTISTWKNHGLSPDQTQSHTQDPKFVLAANTYIEYERYLKACNAVDFDDLILKPVKLFRSNPTILA